LKKKSKHAVLRILLFFSLLPIGCVPKPPQDDVALIKKLLVEFENGLREKDMGVLGSLTSKEQKNLASKLVTDLSAWGEITNIYIASKRFTIVGDSAKVELKFGMKSPEGETVSEEPEKPVNLILNKKKGKWRIETYKIITDEQ
jgi:hypothetical protein